MTLYKKEEFGKIMTLGQYYDMVEKAHRREPFTIDGKKYYMVRMKNATKMSDNEIFVEYIRYELIDYE